MARLVRLTASHDPLPGDRNGGLLTDADLAILAADEEVYRAYTVAVRREYAHVPDAAFAAGRAAVLHNLLGLPSLFHTPVLREHWEEPARHNITRELAALRNNPPPSVDEGTSVVTLERRHRRRAARGRRRPAATSRATTSRLVTGLAPSHTAIR